MIAKAHAHHANAPSRGQINNMISAERIEDVESILQSTVYGDILNTVRPSVDLAGFEVELRRDYAKLLHFFRKTARGDLAQLIDAYMLFIEAENMSLILKAIIQDNHDQAVEKIVIPVGKFGIRHYLRMMENTNAEVATDFILYPQLRKAAQNALKKSQDPDEQMFHVSSALSHVSFSILAEVAPKWVQLEADFLNLETICRAINLGIDPEPWLIPNIGRVYRNRAQLISYSTPEEVINAVLPTFPVQKPLMFALEDPNPVARLEDEVLKYLYYRRYRHFNLYGNRKEAVLDFFSMKKAEIEDIGRILLSKIRPISPSDLREMLYPIYRS